MLSFLNKKVNLVLLIMATLFVLTTITSATALDQQDGVMSYDDSSLSKDATYGQLIAVNGSFDNASSVDLDDNRDVIIYARPVGGGSFDDINVTTTTLISNSFEFTAIFNTSSINNLGAFSLYAAVSDGTDRAFTFPFLTLSVKDTPTITIVPTTGTPRVGQNVTFLVTVTGRNASNTSQMIGLEGVNVSVINQLGNFVADGVTGANGTFNFNYLVNSLSFYFNATTNISANATLSANYTEASASVPFTATKGQANLTALWFDSPWGYVIGQPATILWDFTGIALDTIGNRTITLFYYSNNRLQRTEVVPLYDPLTLNNRTADGHWNTSFTQAHDNLTVIAVFAEDPEYLRSEVRNSTFVDPSNESRRTTITTSFPQGGLKVGVTSDITIFVNRFDGTPVESGSVTILWDGQWRFDVDVRSGVAAFTHTYSLAGAARNVTFTYNGEEAGTRASSVTETTAVLRGTPSIILTQNPQFAIVGQEVNIAGAINNFVLGTNPEYVNLTFSAGNHVWHTINDIPMTFNTESSTVAQVNYAYIMTHANLSLVMSFMGNDNYNSASGTTTTIVSPAPEI